MTTMTETVSRDAEVQQRRWRRPEYSVREEQSRYVVEVLIPGVARDGVDIEIEKDLLSVTAIRNRQPEAEGWKVLHRERMDADFQLKLRLNLQIEESEISAKVENGVLALSLPKKKEAQPRRIEIA